MHCQPPARRLSFNASLFAVMSRTGASAANSGNSEVAELGAPIFDSAFESQYFDFPVLPVPVFRVFILNCMIKEVTYCGKGVHVLLASPPFIAIGLWSGSFYRVSMVPSWHPEFHLVSFSVGHRRYIMFLGCFDHPF